VKIKPILKHEPRKRAATSRRHRRKRLRTIAMLPALLTLGNLFFGFMAIYCCGREMHDLGAGVNPAALLTFKSARWEAIAPTYLAIGTLMLIASMLCDALDGRVARMTDGASKFGEQLDSLADAVSFGVAPAMLMVTMLQRELSQWGTMPLGFARFGQAVLLIAAVYACCTVLRLARFNVEASLEEAAHLGFKGLPSPGAAAAVISLVFLHEHIEGAGLWTRLADFVTLALPVCTLAVALLMVSRVPYTHAVSAFLRRRPFGHVVVVLLVVPLLLMYPPQMAVFGAWAFVLSGPAGMIWRKVRGRRSVVDADEMLVPVDESETVSPSDTRQQRKAQ